MADASCSGPSPFKRLVDHQSRDVSQHQDRLRDTSSPHAQNSFRSQPQNGQTQQNGFGAFIESSTQMPGMHPDPAGRLAAHAAALESPHMPPPQQFRQQQQQQQFQPQARASPAADIANWAADFNRFNSQPTQRRPAQNGMVQQPPGQVDFAAAFAQPQQRYMPGFALQNGPLMHQQPVAAQDGFDAEMSKWMAANGGGNMEQVDAAMEQMAKELELNESLLAQEEEAAAATTAETTENQAGRFTDLETPEIGNLSLENQRTQPPLTDELTAEGKGKSAVSEAAERLLESVQHEDGEKWKNSVFLSLMRDFRDGKKDIVGDEILGNDDNAQDEARE